MLEKFDDVYTNWFCGFLSIFQVDKPLANDKDLTGTIALVKSTKS